MFTANGAKAKIPLILCSFLNSKINQTHRKMSPNMHRKHHENIFTLKYKQLKTDGKKFIFLPFAHFPLQTSCSNCLVKQSYQQTPCLQSYRVLGDLFLSLATLIASPYQMCSPNKACCFLCSTRQNEQHAMWNNAAHETVCTTQTSRHQKSQCNIIRMAAMYFNSNN